MPTYIESSTALFDVQKSKCHVNLKSLLTSGIQRKKGRLQQNGLNYMLLTANSNCLRVDNRIVATLTRYSMCFITLANSEVS